MCQAGSQPCPSAPQSRAGLLLSLTLPRSFSYLKVLLLVQLHRCAATEAEAILCPVPYSQTCCVISVKFTWSSALPDKKSFLIVRTVYWMSLNNSIQVQSNSFNNPGGKALLSILYSNKQAQRGGVTCPSLCSGSQWNLDSGCSKEEWIWLHVSCFFYFNPCILLFLLQVKNVTYSLKYTEEHILKNSHIFHSYRNKKFHNREQHLSCWRFIGTSWPNLHGQLKNKWFLHQEVWNNQPYSLPF